MCHQWTRVTQAANAMPRAPASSRSVQPAGRMLLLDIIMSLVANAYLCFVCTSSSCVVTVQYQPVLYDRRTTRTHATLHGVKTDDNHVCHMCALFLYAKGFHGLPRSAHLE